MSHAESKPGSVGDAGGVGGGRVAYSGLSSVVFVQDVEGDLLGEAPEQTRRVQVPLEAEQPVDPSLRGGAGPTSEPLCRGARRDTTSLHDSVNIDGFLTLRLLMKVSAGAQVVNLYHTRP